VNQKLRLPGPFFVRFVVWIALLFISPLPSGIIGYSFRGEVLGQVVAFPASADGAALTEEQPEVSFSDRLVARLLKAETHEPDAWFGTATFTPIPSYALTVAGSGGLGNITSSPSGISCPSTCVHNFLSGTVVTLTETPIAGYVFSNWSGACSGSGSTTTVTMNAAESCAANFAPNGQGILLNPPFLLQPGSGGILLQ